MNTLEIVYAEVERELDAIIEEMDYCGYKYTPENIATTRMRMRKEALIRYERNKDRHRIAQLFWMTHSNPYYNE